MGNKNKSNGQGNKMTHNKDTLYTVNLVRYRFPNNAVIECGKFSEQEIAAFMKRMSKVRLSHEGCLSCIEMRYENNNLATLLLDEDGGTLRTTTNAKHSDIHLQSKNLCGCGANSCHKNIASGKCTDEFIRSTIGATFFAQHYGKQK